MSKQINKWINNFLKQAANISAPLKYMFFTKFFQPISYHGFLQVFKHILSSNTCKTSPKKTGKGV